MSLKILIDMNLSPDWVPLMQHHGWTAIHWSAVGDPRAPDKAIMEWALANGHTVFTHDLDLGTTLALTHASGPSVLQVRTQDVMPDKIGHLVLAALKQHESELTAGALVTIDAARLRVRVLPL